MRRSPQPQEVCALRSQPFGTVRNFPPSPPSSGELAGPQATLTILRLASLSLLGLCTAFTPPPAAGPAASLPAARRLLSGSVFSLLSPAAVRAFRASAPLAMSTEQGAGKPRALRLEGFAKRQWNAEYKGLVIQMPMQELEAKVNELYWQNPAALQDGYAPFCKHLFVPCFLEGARAEAVPITDDNKALLLSEVCVCILQRGKRARAPREA